MIHTFVVLIRENKPHFPPQKKPTKKEEDRVNRIAKLEEPLLLTVVRKSDTIYKSPDILQGSVTGFCSKMGNTEDNSCCKTVNTGTFGNSLAKSSVNPQSMALD